MMQSCFLCPEWAQWQCRKPIRDADGKIVSFELIALLCGTHKLAQEKMPSNAGLRFDFVGVAPAWH